MRCCPRCSNTAVLEDGYCGVCRECTIQPANPALRPIISSWLPIVQGEVTFPCVFLVRDKQNPGLLMVEVAGNPSCSVPKEAIGWYPIPKQPEQLSAGEKAWAEYCASKPIAMTADKASFMAGRASVEGDPKL